MTVNCLLKEIFQFLSTTIPSIQVILIISVKPSGATPVPTLKESGLELPAAFQYGGAVARPYRLVPRSLQDPLDDTADRSLLGSQEELERMDRDFEKDLQRYTDRLAACDSEINVLKEAG